MIEHEVVHLIVNVLQECLSDGLIVIGAGNDKQYESLCQCIIGRPDLAAQDESFKDNQMSC